MCAYKVYFISTAEDFALIGGKPGTGKTQTIAQIVCALVAAGKSVLLASLTNNALDNVLLKLVTLGVDFFRLASANSEKVCYARTRTRTHTHAHAHARTRLGPYTHL